MWQKGGAGVKFDIFFSLCQTPAGGKMPSEASLLNNFFSQVIAADDMGFGTAWVAESHLSSQVQKRNRHPVMPHWEGEVGLNVDIVQLAHQIFSCTRRIEVGSAVMNILCNGGPVAHAERIAYFAALHGRTATEQRRLHVGFAAGRFDFVNQASGIVPRDAFEATLGPLLKGKIFREAGEIFLRLLRGDTLGSDDIAPQVVSRSDCRSEQHWHEVVAAAGGPPQKTYLIRRRWAFEALKIIPQAWRRALIVPVLGSHDAALQEDLNRICPVQVFNLSFTPQAVIEDTHRRLQRCYHPDGGPWQRHHMPRTVFVFINEKEGLSPQSRREAAQAEAQKTLAAYWQAIDGTVDATKLRQATNNALVGNSDDIVRQLTARFHPDDRLMLWFDFFNNDCARVRDNMQAFMNRVAPKVVTGASP